MIPVGLLLGAFNPAKIFKFVVENWKPLLLITMIGTIGFQYWWYNRTIDNLEQVIEVQKQSLVICEEGNRTLASDINKRNAEITKWKNKSKELEKKNAELQGILGTLRKDTNNKIEDVLNDPTPKTCDAAIEYLRKSIGDITWQGSSQ